MKLKSRNALALIILLSANAFSEILAKISESAVVDGINANAPKEPEFEGPISNATVPVGREAVLTCTVTDLGNYRVVWMKAEDQTILTLHNRVVTHNGRVSVTNDNLRVWQLHIRQVKESDKGCYMCQINTNVMKKQFGCIDVHVPPDIISDNMTVSDVTVNEGENATLTCKAIGHPQPRIVWKREGGENIVSSESSLRKNVSQAVEIFSGEVLHLVKLDRRRMGSYLCIASNDVPPAVSKRITLQVNFAPVITIDKKSVDAPRGTNATLSCRLEAFPQTTNYWVKMPMMDTILEGPRYHASETRSRNEVLLDLTISYLSGNDFGNYTCVATNFMGTASGTVQLKEIIITTTTTTTTSTTTRRTTTSKKTTMTSTTTTPKPTTTRRTSVIQRLSTKSVVSVTVQPSANSHRDRYQQKNSPVEEMNPNSLTGSGSRPVSKYNNSVSLAVGYTIFSTIFVFVVVR